MNPFSGASWLWRAWRARSVTFAVLFSLGVLGVSVLGAFRHVLHHWGAPWYVLFVAPFLVVTLLSRKELDWMPDPEARRRWSRRLVLGSILLLVLMAWLTPNKPSTPPSKPPVAGHPFPR